MNMVPRFVQLIVVAGVAVLSFLFGVFVSSKAIVFGEINFESGGPDQAVVLTGAVKFVDYEGRETEHKAGDQFILEGEMGGQFYLSRRYVLDSPAKIDRVNTMPLPVFFEKSATREEK